MDEHIRPVVSLYDICTNENSVPATREEVMANLTQLMLRVAKTLDQIVKENNQFIKTLVLAVDTVHRRFYLEMYSAIPLFDNSSLTGVYLDKKIPETRNGRILRRKNPAYRM